MVKYDKDLVKQTRTKYAVGTKIMLYDMKGENLPVGLKGTVTFVDDACQIHMKWENGSNLALREDLDKFQIL